MITVTAKARDAAYMSDDLITSGSIGIPVKFVLSSDFDGLSNIAVFEGSGVSIDVALTASRECVVPHEVVAIAGGYLRIGVYGRNGDGTIAIPTVWTAAKKILPGTAPSGVDPSEPTPDWTAQVQQLAADAYDMAEDVQERADRGEFDGEPGISPSITITNITGGHRVTVTDAQGTRSFDVMDGMNGDDGRGIASAVMNADYTLTLTYTDGTSYTTPSLRGEPGSDGYSPVASVSKSGKVATISITDKQGTTTATVSDGEDGAPGVGVPAGGTAGQVLKKVSGTDYDTEWGNEPSVPVQDVQVNGTSVVQDGVANVPVSDINIIGAGAVKANGNGGIGMDGVYFVISSANSTNIKDGTASYRPIVPVQQHNSTFYGLAKAAGSDEKNSTLPVGQYTEAAKSAISTMLGAPVSVTGSAPSITALPGIRYVCGEVATLDITLPASGIVDVVFESGSTATVLTVTPPTGVTLKWANGSDPTALDANTTYEINIMDGLGVAASWT